MHLPSIVYGTFAISQRNVRKALTQVRRGERWNDAMQATGAMETADHPGLLLLNGPNPLLGGDDHFQLYLPLTEFSRQIRKGRFLRDREEDVFGQCLLTLDGLLGLLAPANLGWVYPAHRRQPLVQAAIEQWSVLDAVGARYSAGMATGSRLWDLPTNVKFVLANMGLDIPALNAPLPDGGIPELIARMVPAPPPP